jgi:exoribonuclease-2
MESGIIVEYIDRQKIICAVALEIKKQKLHLLNELNQTVDLPISRILHQSAEKIEISISKDKIVDILKEKALKRTALISQIDIKELWEVLFQEKEGIDIKTMTGLCFPNNATDDHESALIRALFQNRIYFKFSQQGFYPYSEEQVSQLIAQTEEALRKDLLIEEGAAWIKNILTVNDLSATNQQNVKQSEFIGILKSSFLFEKESRHYDICREILLKSQISDMNQVFHLLVKLNVFDKNENLDLYRMEIPVDFSQKTIEGIPSLINSSKNFDEIKRKDLTSLELITIDGQGTQDFDDSISVENKGEYYELGIHIIDVAHFIKKDTAIDKEAMERGSSIYMPDKKISMIPPDLSEDLCSLKAGQIKPAISVMIKLAPSIEVIDYSILPSLIKVKHQLTYGDADALANGHKEIEALVDISEKFRRKRFEQGAVHISLPETIIRVDEKNGINVQLAERESRSRVLVSELMIMANWIMAKHLSKNNMPAIFRSQMEPKERLYKGDEGTLYQNYMQRRLVNRFMLGEKPERHTGLGLDAYVTATSPIRKYFDLVTQRQIRAVYGLEDPYSSEEISSIISMLETTLQNIARIQSNRNRYWILKFLEKKTGEIAEALVLLKRRNNYQILLPDFMIECDLPVARGISLQPEDVIHVKIQHAEARKDLLTVFMR